MALFGFRPPCEDSAARRDQRLSQLLDEDGDDRLRAHVGECVRCGAAIAALRADRAGLAALGDAPGAAPSDDELRRVLAAVSLERATRPQRTWLVWSAATVALALLCAFGLRQLMLTRARAADDAAILAGADAAYRRAEREYEEALAMLRGQLDKRAPDPAVAEGAHTLEAARAKAAALVAERRGDPEREALLRDALRAEVRYYEDALMRAGVSPEPQP
jgi:hypothetical protein